MKMTFDGPVLDLIRTARSISALRGTTISAETLCDLLPSRDAARDPDGRIDSINEMVSDNDNASVALGEDARELVENAMRAARSEGRSLVILDDLALAARQCAG